MQTVFWMDTESSHQMMVQQLLVIFRKENLTDILQYIFLTVLFSLGNFLILEQKEPSSCQTEVR